MRIPSLACLALCATVVAGSARAENEPASAGPAASPEEAMADGATSAPTGAPGTADPGAADEARVQVLVLDITSNGVDEAIVSTVGDLVTVSLSELAQLDVMSGEDMRRAMALEAEKQVVGCMDDSCMAELAGALGAQYVVFGRMGQLGSALVLNLSLFDSEQGRTVSHGSVDVEDAGAFRREVKPAVYKLVRGPLAEADILVPEVASAEAPSTTAAPSPAAPTQAEGEADGSFPVLPVVAATGGLALVATGAALGGVGGLSFLTAGTAGEALQAAEAQAASAATSEQLRDAIATGQTAREDQAAASALVVPLYIAGAAVATVGALVVVGGSAWLGVSLASE